MRVLTQRRTLALLRADISCLNWLRALWFLGVLWCETGVYRLAVFRCGWPDRRLSLVGTFEKSLYRLIADPSASSLRRSRLMSWF